jgi:NAD(P)-dependent dehydrogenase (short-subunit alcohol dehydrogenase family)
MNRLQGKVALVTGGAGGIGSATVSRMAEEGARVIIADLADEPGTALARATGAAYIRLDTTDEDRWRAVVRQIMSDHGRLDVLVNAAGIQGDHRRGSPVDASLEEWRRVISTNLDSAFLGCKSVLPAMTHARRGSIVNVSSLAAFQGTPMSAAYGVSKAGVQQLAKTVAIFGSRGGMQIRCNSVHPGMIRTPMLGKIFTEVGQALGLSPAATEQALLNAIPLKTIGEPDDVAWLIVYLASDEAKYVTGAEFTVDGGWRVGNS